MLIFISRKGRKGRKSETETKTETIPPSGRSPNPSTREGSDYKRLVATSVVHCTNGNRELSTPSPLRGTLSEPDVKLGSLTLIRHKMTLSHFLKALFALSQG